MLMIPVCIFSKEALTPAGIVCLCVFICVVVGGVCNAINGVLCNMVFMVIFDLYPSLFTETTEWKN